jgi:hypothetical protein
LSQDQYLNLKKVLGHLDDALEWKRISIIVSGL